MAARGRTISPAVHKRVNFDDYERNLLTNRRYKLENMKLSNVYGQGGSVMSGSADYSDEGYTLEDGRSCSEESSFVTDESEEDHQPLSVFSRKANYMANSRAFSPQRAPNMNYDRMALSPVNHKENHNRAFSVSKQKPKNPNPRVSPNRRRNSHVKANNGPRIDVNKYVNQAHPSAQNANSFNRNHIEGTSYRPAYNMVHEDNYNTSDQGSANYSTHQVGNRKQQRARSPGKKRGKKRGRGKAKIPAGHNNTFPRKHQPGLNGQLNRPGTEMKMKGSHDFTGYNSNLNYGYSSFIQDSSKVYDGKTFYEKIAKNEFEGMLSHSFKDYLRNSKEELVTVKNVQKIIKGQRFTGKKVQIPGKHNGITLLLDLDETLIHSEEKKPGVNYDAVLQLKNPRGIIEHIGVRIRPYCTEFLERMSQKFEVVVFTAGKQEYAEKVIKTLDPQNKYFSGSLFRQNCSKAHQFHIKDFRVIGNRKIKNMVLVDNLLYSFAANFENGIPIKPYIMGKDDWELMYLADVLTKLNHGDDVSKFLIENMKLYHFYELLAK